MVLPSLKTLQGRLVRKTFNRSDTGDRQPFLWSKGIARLCDFGGPTSYWLAPTENVAAPEMLREFYSGAHGLLWVRMGTGARDRLENDLDRFVTYALPSIDRPFVLLTTDGDISVPAELRQETVAALLASPHLKAWYTQNREANFDQRILPFPIGLDFHTPRSFSSPRRLMADLDGIARSRQPLSERPLQVFCDLAVSLNSVDRAFAVDTLLHCEHVKMLMTRVAQKEIWKLYGDHAFVLSARGFGADCHRTWEALYLGSIVITKTSELDPLYEGLPVVIVEDWAEVRDRANLERWLETYGPLADPERIRRVLNPEAMLRGIRERHLGPGDSKLRQETPAAHHSARKDVG